MSPVSDVLPAPVRRTTPDPEREPRPLPAWAIASVRRAVARGVQDPRDLARLVANG